MAQPRQDRTALNDGGNRTGLVVGEALALLAIVADVIAIYTQALPFSRKVLVAALALLLGLAVAPALPALIKSYRRSMQVWNGVLTAGAMGAAFVLVPSVEGLSPPTHLACDQAITSTSIRITWSEPVNGKVINYEVLRKGVKVGDPAEPKFSDTGLEPETPYDYYVRARGPSNEQERSEPVTCTTQAIAKGLGAPANLVVTAFAATSASLRWEPPASGTPTAFRVMRDGAEIFLTAGTDQMTYDDQGLAPQQTYVYVVRAVDSKKLDSPDSNQILVTTPAKDVPPPPPPPVPPTAPRSLRTVAATQTSVTLAWDAPSLPGTGGLSGYQIAYGSQTVAESGTQRKLDGLSANTTYTFRVAAVSNRGLMSGFTALSVTTPPTSVATHYQGPVEIKPGYGVDVDDPGNDILRDLYMPDRVTLQVINNSNLVLLADSKPMVYDRCQNMGIGLHVEVSELQFGRQLCITTAEGRRGMLQVTKASTAEDPPIRFSAVVWEKP